MKHLYPSFTGILKVWGNLPPGPKAEIRRVSSPEELLELPAFYRLVEPFGWQSGMRPWEKDRWLRVIFLLSESKPGGEHSLGKALGMSGRINEKRLFQILRSDFPADIVQLRRVLKQAESVVNWVAMAKQVWIWDKYRKRNLLEDFVLNQPKKVQPQKTA